MLYKRKRYPSFGSSFKRQIYSRRPTSTKSNKRKIKNSSSLSKLKRKSGDFKEAAKWAHQVEKEYAKAKKLAKSKAKLSKDKTTSKAMSRKRGRFMLKQRY